MKPRVFDLRPTQRRWKDLRKRRLSLGLMVAPIPSVAIGVMLMILADWGANAAGKVAVGVAVILLAAAGWSLLVGWIYLVIVARRRGLLSRAECLVLGIAAAVILPSVAETVSLVIDAVTIGADFAADEPWGSDASTRFFGAILSVALAPFGLLGGWIFWRVGVRPTVTTDGDVAPVFD
jgi:hypothetical protein